MLYKDLSTLVEIEYDKLLKRNGDDQVTQEIDIKMNSNDNQSIVIQLPDNDTSVKNDQLRFPIFISFITLVQIVFYVFDLMYRQNGIYSLSASILLFRTPDKQQVWRFITYMFVHQNTLHLTGNVMFQLLGGITLEISHGWWRVMIVYLAGVVSGSLGVESISYCYGLVGASAGVYSILGAHFSTLILNWNETENRILRVFILLVYVITELLNWLSIPLIAHNSKFGSSACLFISELTNTSITHFCGFLIGLLVAIIVLENSQIHSWERKTQVVCLVVLVLIISLAISLIIFMPEFNIKNWMALKCSKKLVVIIRGEYVS